MFILNPIFIRIFYISSVDNFIMALLILNLKLILILFIKQNIIHHFYPFS